MKNKIYDCITFFEENFQANLRFNILNKHVDKFVVCESIYDHKGNHKGINFDINQHSEFKDKIKHLILKKEFPDTSSPWKTQAFQREYIFEALKDTDDNDLIMFSDPDEIPRPEILKDIKLTKKYGIFLQNMYCYKFNIFNQEESPWEGTRICLRKNLFSINYMRQKVLKKNLKYKFWRVDKEKDIQIINNGGWHFNYLLKPEKISKKLKTFAHVEFGKDEFSNIDTIKKKILEMKDLFNRDHNYQKVKIDNTYPDYIINNKDKFNEWIKE